MPMTPLERRGARTFLIAVIGMAVYGLLNLLGWWPGG